MDVLHSYPDEADEPTPAQLGVPENIESAGPPIITNSFAEWMTEARRREEMTAAVARMRDMSSRWSNAGRSSRDTTW